MRRPEVCACGHDWWEHFAGASYCKGSGYIYPEGQYRREPVWSKCRCERYERDAL